MATLSATPGLAWHSANQPLSHPDQRVVSGPLGQTKNEFVRQRPEFQNAWSVRQVGTIFRYQNYFAFFGGALPQCFSSVTKQVDRCNRAYDYDLNR
jgi:hypothetical protein